MDTIQHVYRLHCVELWHLVIKCHNSTQHSLHPWTSQQWANGKVAVNADSYNLQGEAAEQLLA